MPSQLTIRGVPEGVARRLRAMAKEQDESLNTVLLRLLEQAVGQNSRRAALERYATWTESDLAEFERTLAEQRRVDPDVWQ